MDGFLLTWWMWFVLGLLLLLAEFLTPGALFQLFFGLGAVAVGLLEATGVRMSLPFQLLLFLVLSLGSLALLRKPLQLRIGRAPEEEVDQLVGETVQALEDIAVDGIGKGELRGSVWNVRNVGDTAIARSQRCRVERVQGLTLLIRP